EDLAGLLNEGGAFLRLRVKYEIDRQKLAAVNKLTRVEVAEAISKVPASIEVECNWYVEFKDGEPVLAKTYLWTTSVKLTGRTDGKDSILKKVGEDVGFEVYAKAKTDDLGQMGRTGFLLLPNDTTFGIKGSVQSGAGIGLEWSPTGKARIGFTPPTGKGITEIFVESDMHNAMGRAGVSLDIGRAARLLETKYSPAAGSAGDRFLKGVLETTRGLKIECSAGFVGVREETVLAVVSAAPGFFERRSVTSL